MTDEKKTQVVETPEATKEKEDKSVDKVLTQEQVNQIVQERLAKAQEKMRVEAEAKIKEAQEEAQRLAQLSVEEREAEMQKQYASELQERASKVAIAENRLKAVEAFAREGIPTDLVDFVVKEDAEATESAIETFVNKYKEDVASGVAERLKGQPPKDVNTKTNNKRPEIRTTF